MGELQQLLVIAVGEPDAARDGGSIARQIVPVPPIRARRLREVARLGRGRIFRRFRWVDRQDGKPVVAPAGKPAGPQGRDEVASDDAAQVGTVEIAEGEDDRLTRHVLQRHAPSGLVGEPLAERDAHPRMRLPSKRVAVWRCGEGGRRHEHEKGKDDAQDGHCIQVSNS